MRNQKGQTSVEYVLLLVVMISLSITFFNKVTDLVVDNPDSLVNRYLGGFTKVFGSTPGGTTGVDGQYKRFRLPRGP